MRDGLRKLRHAGTHLSSSSLLLGSSSSSSASAAAVALFVSTLPFRVPRGYGGHRTPLSATAGTNGLQDASLPSAFCVRVYLGLSGAGGATILVYDRALSAVPCGSFRFENQRRLVS